MLLILGDFSEVKPSDWDTFLKDLQSCQQRLHPNKEILLLYNIHQSDIPLNANAPILEFSRSCHVVIALTARELTFSANSVMMEDYVTMYNAQILQVNFFTDAEMECLMQHSTRQDLNIDDLKLKTLGSPKLVSTYLCNDQSKEIALTNLKSKYMTDLHKWKCKIYMKQQESLSSIYFMQRVNERLSETDEESFKSSLVAQLKVLFTDKEKKILCSCFHIYHTVMDFLFQCVADIPQKNNDFELKFADAVKGCRFEYIFCNEVQKLDLLILKARQKQPREVSINVRSRRVVDPGDTLTALEDDVLYMLQPCHPSIDAVICHDNIVYLIQLSIMSYKLHKTKVDSVNMLFRNSSVLEHYKRHSSSRYAAYIYLTTSESPFLKDMDHSMTELSYVGIVKDKSDLNRFICNCRDRISTAIKFS